MWHAHKALSLLALSGLIGLGACVSERVYTQSPLSDQILKPRPGHEGKLTNRVCLEYDGHVCKHDRISEYEFSDQVFRDTVNQLNFICSVGGRRFKICKDKAGLCRFTYTQKCFLGICGKKEKLEEFIPAERYQFLLDANTKCFNQESYSLEDMG